MIRILPSMMTALGFTLLGVGASLQAASVSFLPLNDEIAARKIAFQDAKGITKLADLNPLKRSKSYTFNAGKKPLELLEMNDAASPDKPAAVAISISPEIKSALILILPDPKNPAALMGIAMDDSNKAFTWGTIRFINASPETLMIRYEKEEKALPASFTPVDIAPGGDAHNMGMRLFRQEKPAEVLYSAVWEHDPNVRKLVVILPGTDVKLKPFELSIVPETRPAKN